MARNGSGTYAVPNSFTAGTAISSTLVNQNFTDAGVEITNSVAVDGQSVMTGPLKAASGTAAAPSITFGADTNAGLYRIGADNLGITLNGSKVGDWSTTGLSITGTLAATSNFAVNTNKFTVAAASGNTVVAGTLGVAGVASFVDGAVSAPGLTFTSDTDSGVYRIGANNIGVAVNGAKVLDISATGLAVTGAVTGTSVTATNAAAQSDQETATSTTTFVSPGRQKHHPAHPKAVGYFTVSGSTATLQWSYGVTSVTRTYIGTYAVVLSSNMSSAAYAVLITSVAGAERPANVHNGSQAEGQFTIEVWDGVGNGNKTDPNAVSFAVFGDE